MSESCSVLLETSRFTIYRGMWQNASWAVRYLSREKFKVGIFNSMFFRCLIKVEINLLDQKEGITLQMLCVCNCGEAIQSPKVTLSAFYTFLQLHFTFKCKIKLYFYVKVDTRAHELFSQSKSFILRGTWYRYTLDTPTVPNQFRLSVQIRLV